MIDIDTIYTKSIQEALEDAGEDGGYVLVVNDVEAPEIREALKKKGVRVVVYGRFDVEPGRSYLVHNSWAEHFVPIVWK